jgi:hypothetical protein
MRAVRRRGSSARVRKVRRPLERSSARSLRWAICVAALLLVACGGARGCGKGRNKVFESPAPQPRGYMIALRSYRGGRETLMDAAIAMMRGNPRFGETAGAADAMYLAATEDEPAHAVCAMTFKNSSASIAELLGMMQAITERLTPVPDRDPAHPTLKLELWWVEGVHEEGMGIELPNPLILKERWANALFAVGSEPYAVYAIEAGRESRVWGARVGLMFERSDGLDPRILLEGALTGFETKEEQGRFIYEIVGRDEGDIFANSATVAFSVDVHLQRYLNEAEFRADEVERQGRLATDVVEERSLSWVEPVSIELPKGSTLAERCASWLTACRRAAQHAHLAVHRVVVFDLGAGHVRGALLGERVPEAKLVPFAEFEGAMQAEKGPDDPDVQPGFWAELRVRVPELPPGPP